eukprot:SAG31_NODE_726_length_12541_cov_4.922922_4_plen_1524_part_00
MFQHIIEAGAAVLPIYRSWQERPDDILHRRATRLAAQTAGSETMNEGHIEEAHEKFNVMVESHELTDTEPEPEPEPDTKPQSTDSPSTAGGLDPSCRGLGEQPGFQRIIGDAGFLSACDPANSGSLLEQVNSLTPERARDIAVFESIWRTAFTGDSLEPLTPFRRVVLVGEKASLKKWTNSALKTTGSKKKTRTKKKTAAHYPKHLTACEYKPQWHRQSVDDSHYEDHIDTTITDGDLVLLLGSFRALAILSNEEENPGLKGDILIAGVGDGRCLYNDLEDILDPIIHVVEGRTCIVNTRIEPRCTEDSEGTVIVMNDASLRLVHCHVGPEFDSWERGELETPDLVDVQHQSSFISEDSSIGPSSMSGVKLEGQCNALLRRSTIHHTGRGDRVQRIDLIRETGPMRLEGAAAFAISFAARVIFVDCKLTKNYGHPLQWVSADEQAGRSDQNVLEDGDPTTYAQNALHRRLMFEQEHSRALSLPTISDQYASEDAYCTFMAKKQADRLNHVPAKRAPGFVLDWERRSQCISNSLSRYLQAPIIANLQIVQPWHADDSTMARRIEANDCDYVSETKTSEAMADSSLFSFFLKRQTAVHPSLFRVHSSWKLEACSPQDASQDKSRQRAADSSHDSLLKKESAVQAVIRFVTENRLSSSDDLITPYYTDEIRKAFYLGCKSVWDIFDSDFEHDASHYKNDEWIKRWIKGAQSSIDRRIAYADVDVPEMMKLQARFLVNTKGIRIALQKEYAAFLVVDSLSDIDGADAETSATSSAHLMRSNHLHPLSAYCENVVRIFWGALAKIGHSHPLAVAAAHAVAAFGGPVSQHRARVLVSRLQCDVIDDCDCDCNCDSDSMDATKTAICTLGSETWTGQTVCDALLELVQDVSANNHSRRNAAELLCTLAAALPRHRKTTIEATAACLNEVPSTLQNIDRAILVGALKDLRARECIDAVRLAFERNAVDVSWNGDYIEYLIAVNLEVDVRNTAVLREIFQPHFRCQKFITPVHEVQARSRKISIWKKELIAKHNAKLLGSSMLENLHSEDGSAQAAMPATDAVAAGVQRQKEAREAAEAEATVALTRSAEKAAELAAAKAEVARLKAMEATGAGATYAPAPAPRSKSPVLELKRENEAKSPVQEHNLVPPDAACRIAIEGVKNGPTAKGAAAKICEIIAEDVKNGLTAEEMAGKILDSVLPTNLGIDSNLEEQRILAASINVVQEELTQLLNRNASMQQILASQPCESVEIVEGLRQAAAASILEERNLWHCRVITDAVAAGVQRQKEAREAAEAEATVALTRSAEKAAELAAAKAEVARLKAMEATGAGATYAPAPAPRSKSPVQEELEAAMAERDALLELKRENEAKSPVQEHNLVPPDAACRIAIEGSREDIAAKICEIIAEDVKNGLTAEDTVGKILDSVVLRNPLGIASARNCLLAAISAYRQPCESVEIEGLSWLRPSISAAAVCRDRRSQLEAAVASILEERNLVAAGFNNDAVESFDQTAAELRADKASLELLEQVCEFSIPFA